MRGAGLPIEALIEYVKLCQKGDATIPARLQLHLKEQKQQLEAAMDKLDYKISRYEEAVKTGKLIWEDNKCI